MTEPTPSREDIRQQAEVVRASQHRATQLLTDYKDALAASIAITRRAATEEPTRPAETATRPVERPAMPHAHTETPEGTPGPHTEAERLRRLNQFRPAYDAVYAYLRNLQSHMPPDREHRNAMIWHAVNAALDAQAAEVRAAALNASERQFLRFALDLAADQMASRGDEFTDEDEAALESLRTLATTRPDDTTGGA